MRELFPLALLASGGGVSVDIDITFLAQLIMFAGFIVIMKPLVFDPLIGLFEAREKQTTGAIADARQLEDRAAALSRQVDAELDEVRREAAKHRDALRAEAAKVEAAMLADARLVAADTVARGKAKVGQDIELIRAELVQQRDGLAAQIATRVLRREVKP